MHKTTYMYTFNTHIRATNNITGLLASAKIRIYELGIEQVHSLNFTGNFRAMHENIALIFNYFTLISHVPKEPKILWPKQYKILDWSII